MTSATHRSPEEILLGFARALRAAGVDVTADRERAFLVAASAVGLEDAAAVRWAGRATLCASPEDLARFDLVYAAWFGGERASMRSRPSTPQVTTRSALGEALQGEGESTETTVAQASSTEVLRQRDVTSLTIAEKEALAAELQGEIQRRLRFKADITLHDEGAMEMEYGSTGKAKLVKKMYQADSK